MNCVSLPIDKSGRIRLPEEVLERLGLQPEDEATLELSGTGVLIRNKNGGPSLTERIAALNLPVADWDQMKSEIEAGRRS